jgi:hypothetical protein
MEMNIESGKDHIGCTGEVIIGDNSFGGDSGPHEIAIDSTGSYDSSEMMGIETAPGRQGMENGTFSMAMHRAWKAIAEVMFNK